MNDSSGDSAQEKGGSELASAAEFHDTNDRKIEHIQVICEQAEVERHGNHFDAVHLLHRGLPECDYDEVDPSVDWLGKTLSFPLLISSMTGGDHRLLRDINRRLVQAAEATGVAMAVGSQRVMLQNAAAAECFELRSFAPSVPLIANLGAVQLNELDGVQACNQAIDVLGADGIYLHCNPLQEIIQPEGDRNFKGLFAHIKQLSQALSVPVLLKEVGCGLSKADIELCIQAGVKWVDVAGRGGTSWSRIEHHRAQQWQERSKVGASGDSSDGRSSPSGGDDALGLLFQDWGIPTPLALQMAAPYANQVGIIASGGIRNGIDMVKSVVLGAHVCGLARPFLEPAMESTEAVIDTIERLRQAFKTAMFLMGVTSVDRLRGQTQLLLRPA